jgi:RNA polymerase sigma factor (TIGR02999 family)
VNDNDNNKQAPGEVTRLLQSWADGDAAALEALWPLVYDDVRRLARRQMAGERGDHTLQGTALVNEAFIRLAGQRVFEWQNREQFLSLAAQIMRRVLVDHARQRAAQRRGDGARRVSLEDTQAAIEIDEAQALRALDDERVDVLAIDSALTKLSQIDAPQGRIVELRYFGGLTLEETASVAGISLATVKRELAMARAWLRRELATQNLGAAT